jgi:pimeloyl-ACP methyl ester carboxylesterase
MTELDAVPLEELWFERGSVRLHAMAAGSKSDPVAILLHGFPEFWYSWHKQIEPLARAGYRVVVPDQRGYNLSDKPPSIQAYAMPELVSDVEGIIDQLGQEQVYLAGHDWGAAVAWATAQYHPQRLIKLAILNVPHPAVMLRALQRKPRQMLRSWYIAFFQLPRLPEQFFSRNNFRVGVASLVGSSLPGTFSAEDLERYREAWSRPGTVTAMINWYRSFRRHRPKLANAHIRVPTRILWGKLDRFLLPEMAEESVSYCDAAELTYFPDNTHWLQHECPDAVTAALLSWFC